MTDTATNGHRQDPFVSPNGWPTLEAPLVLPNGGQPLPPPPPPPPPAPAGDPFAPPVGPAGPLPVGSGPLPMPAAPEPAANEPAPVAYVAPVAAYPVGSWPLHPPVEGDSAEAPASQAPTSAPTALVVATASDGEPPKKKLGASLGAWWKGSRRRNRTLTLAGCAILGLLTVRYTTNTISAALAGPLQQIAADSHQSQQAAQQTGRVDTVVIPTDFFPCPLTPFAETAIGWANGGQTLDPQRSTRVAAQVRTQLGLGVRLPDMYVTTPDKTTLLVVQGPVAEGQGTKLFDCSLGSGTAGQPSPTTAAAPTATSAPTR